MSLGNIVFLAANASYSHTNLAGWYLRGYAESAGWSWQEAEIIRDDSLSAVLLRVLRLNPDIIAASFYLFNHHFLLSFISRFKMLQPGCLVIGGGPEFLGDNRDFLEKHHEVDAVIRGEGEQAFAGWLKYCRRPGKWRKIKGLCAVIDGNYIDNGKAELIANLDDIPSPFRGNLSGFKKPFLLLETSRGCSNKCAFCTSAGAPLRFFSFARVCKDLACVTAAGVTEVRVADRTFNENLPRCGALIKIMRDEFKNIRFHLEIDPARVSAEMIRELSLAESGKFHLEVGIQATRSEALRSIGRFGSVKRSLTALNQLCQLRNLAIHVDLIAGLPGITLADLQADLQTIALMRPDEIQLELLKVLPGTQLSREGEKFGIIAASEPPYEVLQTADMRFDDIVEAQRLSRLVDWFYNTAELRESLIAAIRLLPAFFGQFTDFCGDITGAGHAPALETRFRLLEQFCRLKAPVLIPGLGYAWLKWGLSAQHGICRTTQWKKPLPKEAVLVEGTAGAARQRIYLAELDRPYLFVYGQYPRRQASAVYVLPNAY
ncbi:MAG: DUF4080 domain-containing protein [Kiritimatiellia bacterium]|nr:DUF4080 domain-containing protein [Kiritimatiellia bacterium]